VVQSNLGAQNSSMIRAMEGSSGSSISSSGNTALAQVTIVLYCKRGSAVFEGCVNYATSVPFQLVLTTHFLRWSL
jgi:hypothetical protein